MCSYILGLRHNQIYLVQNSGFLRARRRSYFIVRDLTSTTDTRSLRLKAPQGLVMMCPSCCFTSMHLIVCLMFKLLPLNMQIRGGHHLVIYSLPDRKDFYPEVLTRLPLYAALCLKLCC
jgi:hypothetical protein